MRTSPAPSGGSGCSWTASTLGGPCLVITTARTRAAYLLTPGKARRSGPPGGPTLQDTGRTPAGLLTQVDRPPVDEPLRRDDLLDDARGDERVGRYDDRGEPP